MQVTTVTATRPESRSASVVCWVALPGIVLATVLSDPLVRFLLVERWAAAGPIFFWLGLTGVVQTVLNLTGAQGLQGQPFTRLFALGLGLAHATEIFSADFDRVDRLQGQPLHRVKRRRQRRTNRLSEMKARIGHHQKQRQRAEEHQLGQRRRPLVKEGRQGSVESS